MLVEGPGFILKKQQHISKIINCILWPNDGLDDDDDDVEMEEVKQESEEKDGF